MPHNHKRKPKGQNNCGATDGSSPPGLSKPNENGYIGCDGPFEHFSDLLQLFDSRLEDLAHRVKGIDRITSIVDGLSHRVECIEALLLGSNFTEFDRLDAFIKGFAADPPRKGYEGCEFFDVHSDTECIDEDAQDEEFLQDAWTLLADMALVQGSEICFTEILIEISPSVGLAPSLPEVPSLLMYRLSKQCASDLAVKRAKEACEAYALVGRSGTMAELRQADVISVGTILESASFGDHVFIRGFNGIQYVSASPIVKIKEMEGSTVTICDASVQPTLDRGGRVAFGMVDRASEQFVIIGHARWLCGAITSFEELHEDRN